MSRRRPTCRWIKSTSHFPIQTVSTGFAFAIVPLRSLATLAKLEFDLKAANTYLASTDARLFFFVASDSDRANGLRARMLFYGGEDPATGSASGCTAAWMVRHGLAKSDEQVLILQGVEMKRPSRYLRAREASMVLASTTSASAATAPK